MNHALGEPKDTERIELLAADMGYFKLEEIWLLQQLNIVTAIRDPHGNRRQDLLNESDRTALALAKQAVRSETGKLLLNRMGELVERSFEHVLDCGGARKAMLRGRQNIRKRYLIQTAGANLSMLMRHLVGTGTPKQALVAGRRIRAAFIALIRLLRALKPFENRRLAPHALAISWSQ